MSRRRSDLGLFRPAESVSQLLRHTHRAFMRTLESRINKYGIVLSTWFLLRVLWEEDGLSQAELGDRIGIVGPTAVSATRRLIQEGLAVRRSDPGDKRKVRIFLTPRARQLRPALMAEAKDVVELATAGIETAEIDALKSTLRQVAINLGRFVPPAVLAEIRAQAVKDGARVPPKRARKAPREKSARRTRR